MASKYLQIFMMLMILPWLLSCSQKLSDYQNMQPKLDLFEYFNGHVIALGDGARLYPYADKTF